MQESDEVTFTCVAKGRPTLNIVWLFNGNDLQDDIFRTVEISGSVAVGDQVTSTLTVTQARDIHSGEITCMATNQPVTLEETFTATSTAILTVLCELDYYILASNPGFSSSFPLLCILKLEVEMDSWKGSLGYGYYYQDEQWWSYHSQALWEFMFICSYCNLMWSYHSQSMGVHVHLQLL